MTASAASRAPAALDTVVALHGVRVLAGNRTVIERIDLRVGAGEIVAVVGPSGVGKTSLLRVVAGQRPPGAGTVERSPGRIAVAFQDPTLLPWRDALDNVLFPLGRRPRPAERERADALLGELGLAGVADRYPDHLSGGMRQRVNLARALACGPRLLVADEPFAHLDHDSQARVGELLVARAAGGCAVVLASHEPHWVDRLAHRVVDLGAPLER